MSEPIQNNSFAIHTTNNISLKDKIMKYILGPQTMFVMRAFSYLSNNKTKIEHLHLKNDIQDCEKEIRKCTIASLALSGALALSIRRYFPSMIGSLSIKQIAMDMTILTACMAGGIIYGSGLVEQKIGKIEQRLIEQKNKNFIQFLKDFENKYAISMNYQLRMISNNPQEFEKYKQIVESIKNTKNKQIL